MATWAALTASAWAALTALAWAAYAALTALAVSSVQDSGLVIEVHVPAA